MKTRLAFFMAQVSKSSDSRVFDWEKAARLIKEDPIATFKAGLKSDLEDTLGTIWKDGSKVEEYTYLASMWDIPQIVIDGIPQDCYRMQSETPNWDAQTKFPKEFDEILGLS